MNYVQRRSLGIKKNAGTQVNGRKQEREVLAADRVSRQTWNAAADGGKFGSDDSVHWTGNTAWRRSTDSTSSSSLTSIENGTASSLASSVSSWCFRRTQKHQLPMPEHYRKNTVKFIGQRWATFSNDPLSTSCFISLFHTQIKSQHRNTRRTQKQDSSEDYTDSTRCVRQSTMLLSTSSPEPRSLTLRDHHVQTDGTGTFSVHFKLIPMVFRRNNKMWRTARKNVHT